MLRPTLQDVRFLRPRGFSPALLLLLVTLLTASAHAQLSEGSGAGLGDSGVRGANNTIQGNIFYPSGRRADKRLQVRISSVRGLDYSTMSDENGSFSFRRLPGGTYYVTVDAGKEYLPVTETVSVLDQLRNTSGQTYIIQVQLQPRPSGEGGAGVLNAALAGVPEAAREFYEKAVKSAQTGDNRKAVEFLKKAVDLYPQFMLAYNELGVQYFRLGDLNNASDALTQAIKLSPDTFSPRLNYGIVLFYKKQYQGAAEELDRSLKINETSGIAHLFRGRLFVKANDFDKAEKEFLRAVSLGGEVGEAHRFLGAIYNERGDYGRALQELETYLKVSPNVKDAEQVRQIIRELRTKAAASRD